MSSTHLDQLPPEIRQSITPQAGNGGGKAPPGSLVARLRDAAAAQREAKTVDFDLPGRLHGLLRVRYHGLPLSEWERYIDLIAKNRTGQLSVGVDMMAACCEHMLVATDQGEWEILEDEHGPVKFDRRLAALMGLPDADDLEPRDVILGLMVVGDNSTPLVGHVRALEQWLDEDDPTPGESSAATPSPPSGLPPRSE